MMRSATTLEVHALPGVPLVRPGDDLARIIADAVGAAGIAPRDQDIIVVAQKIVSKAEHRYRCLDEVSPTPRARALAREVEKDPRLVQVILSESTQIVRHRPGLLIARHRLGFVMANAGVDHSNLAPEGGRERVLLLPLDPNASSARLKAALDARFGAALGVLVCDSTGRAWRNGVVGVALGLAGLPAVQDRRGDRDIYGRELRVTQVGFADGVASMAALLMGEGDERTPLALVRGLEWSPAGGSSDPLVRPVDQDLFR